MKHEFPDPLLNQPGARGGHNTTAPYAVFDPDQPVRILGATPTTITIATAWLDGTDADYGTGALLLPRWMYDDAVIQWLDRKTDSYAACVYGEGIEIMFAELERMLARCSRLIMSWIGVF